MSNRRTFIKKSLAFGLVSAGAGIPFEAFAGAERWENELVILHTNDVHSRLDPFPENDRKYPGMGGVAKRASLINAIRQKNRQVLLFDSGDMLQGTPYFNYYQGEPEIKSMNALKYDAGTIGNHDFDAGHERLAELMKMAAFPFLNCNYAFNNDALKGQMDQYGNFKIFEFPNFKIGVTGVGVELQGLVPKKLFGQTIYNDPVDLLNKTARKLKEDQNCDLVICLSHLGHSYKSNKISDVELAKKTDNVDIILGGHTHTFLERAEVVKNLKDKPVIINQVGWAGLYLGRINIGFQRGREKKLINSSPVIIS